MQPINLICHNSIVALSFLACIAGLVLLWDRKQNKADMEETERVLFRMSFSYWLVYCVTFGIQKMVVPDWETAIMSLKITTALSYFLTFSCIVSLPLHKLAVHRRVED